MTTLDSECWHEVVFRPQPGPHPSLTHVRMNSAGHVDKESSRNDLINTRAYSAVVEPQQYAEVFYN